MNTEHDTLSLFSLQKTYLVEKLKELCAGSGLYALVLDRKTKHAVFLVVLKDTLLRIVTTVEVLEDSRRVLNYLLAIYLVEPVIYNFNCILADIHTNRYKLGVGLFVPFSQWDEQANKMFHLNRFLHNPQVSAYFDGGNAVSFVHSAMVPVDSRVFLADHDTPNSMPIYYNENCADLVLPQIRRSAKAIVNAVVVAGEYPLIRFYSLPEASHQAARLPELIADEVQRQLDDYARANHDFPPQHGPEKPRAILLICDRTLDLYAPLLHEFTYQAMAMDIVYGLEREGVYKYQSENEKGEAQTMETRLDSEKDETWLALRHLHIIEASELIINKIGELIKNNPMMVDRFNAKTSSDLMYVVAHLQGFDEERRQVTLHKSLIDECLDINATRKLAEYAADFEQTCAAEGTLFEGVHNKHLHDDLIVLLARDDLHVNDKMRLVLIYGLYRGGLCEADFVKLAKFIGVRDNQIVSLVLRCFYNLRKLNYPIVKSLVKDKSVSRQTFHTINNEGTYNTSRFTPGIKRVLYNAAKYELDEDWFPYFRDKPLEEDLPGQRGLGPAGLELTRSLRNPRIKASWAPSSSRSSKSRVKQRVFCFVAGGVTHSEMRLVHKLSANLNKDFFLGSECILKPRDFLIGLQHIDDAKNPENLQIPLLRILAEESGQAPDHLFQVQKPAALGTPQSASSTKTPSVPAPRTPTGTKPQTAPASAQSMFNPALPEGKPGSTTPAHYQKRTQYTTSLEPEPTKEKKLSRLKKFFK